MTWPECNEFEYFQIFVTQGGNEVELVITQPPLEVRQFVDQIKT